MKILRLFLVVLSFFLGGLMRAEHINGAFPPNSKGKATIQSQNSSYDPETGQVVFILNITHNYDHRKAAKTLIKLDIDNIDYAKDFSVTVNNVERYNTYKGASSDPKIGKTFFSFDTASMSADVVIIGYIKDKTKVIKFNSFEFQVIDKTIDLKTVNNILDPKTNLLNYAYGKMDTANPIGNNSAVNGPKVESKTITVYHGGTYPNTSIISTDPNNNIKSIDVSPTIAGATINKTGLNSRKATITVSGGSVPITTALGSAVYKITATDVANDKGIGKLTIITKSQADAYDPTAKTGVSTAIGVKPSAESLINTIGLNSAAANSGLPADGKNKAKTYAFKTEPNVSTAGVKNAVVVITYEDGSKDEVDVSFTVRTNQADDYNPTAYTPTIYTMIGDIPAAGDFINKTGLPDNATYSWKAGHQINDKNSAGTKNGIVIVRYNDGTEDEVNVSLNVVDPFKVKKMVVLKGDRLDNLLGIASQFIDFITTDLNGYTPTIAWQSGTPDTSNEGIINTGKIFITYTKGTQKVYHQHIPTEVEVVAPSLQGEISVEVGTSEANTKTRVKNNGMVAATPWAKGDVISVPSTNAVADFITRDTNHATGNGAVAQVIYTGTTSVAEPKYVLNAYHGTLYKNVEYSGGGTANPVIKTNVVVAVRVVDTTRPVPPAYPNVWVIKDVPLDYTLPQATDNVGVTNIRIAHYSISNNSDANIGGLSATIANGTQKLVGTAGATTTEGVYQRRMEVGDEAGNTAKSERFSIYIVGITSSGITKNAGETVSEQEIKDKVVITAGNQTANIPSGEFVKEIISVNGVAYNGSNLPTSGNNIVKVKITNPTTGQVKIVDVPVNFNQNQADTHEPIGQVVKTPKGTLPEAKGSIFNTSELPTKSDPEGYTWHQSPDVNSVGLKDAVVKVVYTDGSFDLVNVKVFVYENETITNTRLEVEPVGKVGINTDKPQAMLDVRFVPNQENTTKAFELKNANGDKVLTLTKDGNLGFNTDNPTAKLHIKGTMPDENNDASLMVLRNISGANRSNDNLSGALKFVNENNKVYGAIATKPSELGLVGHSDKGLSAVMKAENGTDYSQIITKANGVNRIIFEVKTSNGTYKTLVDENNHWRLGGNNLNENESIKERIVVEGALRVGSEASATAGTMRYNTTSGNLEVHNGTDWVQVNND